MTKKMKQEWKKWLWILPSWVVLTLALGYHFKVAEEKISEALPAGYRAAKPIAQVEAEEQAAYEKALEQATLAEAKPASKETPTLMALSNPTAIVREVIQPQMKAGLKSMATRVKNWAVRQRSQQPRGFASLARQHKKRVGQFVLLASQNRSH